jgi:hypothetical protein
MANLSSFFEDVTTGRSQPSKSVDLRYLHRRGEGCNNTLLNVTRLPSLCASTQAGWLAKVIIKDARFRLQRVINR